MSEKAAADFVGRLAIDPTLFQEMTAALAGATDGPQYLSKAVEFAAQHGYEVTAEELARFALPTDEGRELSDADLSKVAGGFGAGVALRPIGVPSLCAGVNCGGTNCTVMV